VKSRTRSKTFENLNSFLEDVENAKNDANILKMYFFGFLLFFAIFGFFEIFIKKVGQKLGNNNCLPLLFLLFFLFDRKPQSPHPSNPFVSS
jgi:hypothetical protein